MTFVCTISFLLSSANCICRFLQFNMITIDQLLKMIVIFYLLNMFLKVLLDSYFKGEPTSNTVPRNVSNNENRHSKKFQSGKEQTASDPLGYK